jgi:hypothetical protein
MSPDAEQELMLLQLRVLGFGLPHGKRYPRLSEEDGLAPVQEEEPEIYEQEELDALFKACDDQERLWFGVFRDDRHERTGSHVHVLV